MPGNVCFCVHLHIPVHGLCVLLVMLVDFCVGGRTVGVVSVEEGASLWPHTQASSQLLTLTWS